MAAAGDPIRLVLDATAVRVCPHVGVSEPITQVKENGGAFTVPPPVLVGRRHVDRRWLNLLLGHPAFPVVRDSVRCVAAAVSDGRGARLA